MNYLIPTFDCFVVAEEVFYLTAFAKYEFDKKTSEKAVVYSNLETIPFLFESEYTNSNILKVNNKGDCFFFLFPSFNVNPFFTTFKYKSKQICVCLSRELTVTIDGSVTLNENVQSLKYSHFEIYNDFCLIYFSGMRNYVVVIRDDNIIFSNYYDECNVLENEKYFMCKLNDSLNHGEVCYIKEKESSVYLVYLDNAELKLKPNFVGHVFLDCLKAKNFNYCNSLLSDDLKVESVENIKEFFPTFDIYYPIEKDVFILIKKNTLAGIYKFEICDNKIINITSH